MYHVLHDLTLCVHLGCSASRARQHSWVDVTDEIDMLPKNLNQRNKRMSRQELDLSEEQQKGHDCSFIL